MTNFLDTKYRFLLPLSLFLAIIIVSGIRVDDLPRKEAKPEVAAPKIEEEPIIPVTSIPVNQEVASVSPTTSPVDRRYEVILLKEPETTIVFVPAPTTPTTTTTTPPTDNNEDNPGGEENVIDDTVTILTEVISTITPQL